jgi:hypothetical protein
MINDKQCVPLKVIAWDIAAGAGTLLDKQDEQYPISKQQLDPSFSVVPPRVGEILQGVIVGPRCVIDVVDPTTERVHFDSVGANPDGNVVATEPGKRLEGGRPQIFGTPHDGRILPGRERR